MKSDVKESYVKRDTEERVNRTFDTVMKRDAKERVDRALKEEIKRDTETRSVSKGDITKESRTVNGSQAPKTRPAVHDIWMSPDTKTEIAQEKTKVEEIIPQRQKIKNEIAELSIKRNMLASDDVNEKAILNKKIDDLKIKLESMPED